MFSSALHWAVEKRAGVTGVAHYLDDFLFVGEKGSEQAGNLLKCAEQLFEEVGVPVAHDKTVLPTTKLSYLGIEIDSEEGQVRLPMEKVLKARAVVVGMVDKKKVSLREMQGLLGLLNFASLVIPMGRIFSRRPERATVGVRRPLHKIRITRQLREDLKVWEAFLINFNGVRLWREPPKANGQMQLYTDAAGAVGFGAFFQGQWCAERWPEAWHSQGLTRNLALLELFPIVVALELWYEGLANKEVVFWTDNMSVVCAINQLSSGCQYVLALLRRLVWRCMRHNIRFTVRHVPGVDNRLADALSREKWDVFFALAPGANKYVHNMFGSWG
ncbi:uncharacterized protein WCC33_006111 [Rhinophrynus dorsalis]